MVSSVISWGGIRRAKKTDMRETNDYIPVATLYVNGVHNHTLFRETMVNLK